MSAAAAAVNGATRTHGEILANVKKEIAAKEAKAPIGPRFGVMTADAIFAPLEPPVEIITECVRASSLCLLAGFGSGSKTWQGIDACVSVELGEPWLGRFATKRGPTAFIDFESGTYESRRRLQALARSRGLTRVDGLGLVSMPGLYLGEPDFIVAMTALAKTRSVIVIDSLRAASLVDENDSRIRLGLDQLRSVGERTQCAFIVLVHAKKTSGTPTQVDEREVLRGSSAVFDAADVVFVSTYKKDDERFDVVQVKARHGRKVDPFTVRLRDERGGVSVRAEDMPEDERSHGRADKWEAAVAGVRRVLKEHAGIGRRELRTRVGGNASAVDGAVDFLIEAGEVVNLPKTAGGRTTHSYRLNADGAQ